MLEQIKKLIEKHAEMIDKTDLPKTEKRLLLIKSWLHAGLFTGEKLSKIVRHISESLGFSERTVWRAINFDKLYKQIENDYTELLKYLKMMEIKEKIGEISADTQQQS